MEQQELSLFEERKVFSVTEVVEDVRNSLEGRFRDIWVQGEISNLRRPPSGHLYLTLKDAASQISGVCFRMQNQYLKFDPSDGLTVIARGTFSVYPARGQLQMIIEFMEPLGQGALQLAFEELKARLQAEGLFDSAHKKSLPLLPDKIAIVTSPSGAAVADILRVLRRRNDKLDILIYPSRVQGSGAADELARGIRYLNRRPDIDVIILARGGGSLEDLWAFNEEVVARAIFDSKLPVISAVGHEIDFTISDFVADLRAATPSAAAEIVSGTRTELTQRIRDLQRRGEQAIRLSLHEKRHQLHRLASSRAMLGAENRLRLLLQRLDELVGRLQTSVPNLLRTHRQRLQRVERDCKFQIHLHLQHHHRSLESAANKLQAISPLRVLERGYAIVTTNTGHIVRDPLQLSPDERFQIQVEKGVFSAQKKENQ